LAEAVDFFLLFDNTPVEEKVEFFYE